MWDTISEKHGAPPSPIRISHAHRVVPKRSADNGKNLHSILTFRLLKGVRGEMDDTLSLTMYEGKDEKTCTALISLQPLVVDQAAMPHMRAMYVPFNMVYGWLMCYQRLQSDRPK